MTKDEAERLITSRLDNLSKKSYAFLQDLAVSKKHLTEEVKDSSGVEYQLDIHAFYDDKTKKTIRVLGSVFQIKEIAPWWLFWKNIDSSVANSDFIMKSDGSLVED